jgi:hypothetical protein
MKQLILSILMLQLVFSCNSRKSNQQKSVNQNREFAINLKPVKRNQTLKSKSHYVWGGSVVKGDDGFYHMFYSTWGQQFGFNAWVTHSEIAHAVSKSAQGPFEYKDMALPVRGKQFWNGMTTHNPTVKKFGDKYYLYYMGTTGNRKKRGGLNFVHRNNQRIGVAVAETPNGPWKQFKQPLIDVSSDTNAYDALMVSNPSVTQMRDGNYLMVYKSGAKKNKMPFGGPVYHLTATSKSPIGPFKKQLKPIFHKEGVNFAAEDPYVWYSKNYDKYFAIVKDFGGHFTKAGQSLALFESNDAFDWKVSKQALVSTMNLRWKDGTQKMHRIERPQVLVENGEVLMLYCAVIDPKEKLTYNVHFSVRRE